jgi:hypothetical protein
VNADHFSKDVQEFLRLVSTHDVRYVLIGGAAVIYHGYARFTGDIAFLYDCSPQNAARLWAALVEFWGGSVPAVNGPQELANPKLVVQFGRPPNRIDLIASLASVTFEEAWRNRIRERLFMSGVEVPVWIMGLADLRRSKREAGRPKDLDDLEHLPG